MPFDTVILLLKSPRKGGGVGNRWESKDVLLRKRHYKIIRSPLSLDERKNPKVSE